MGYGTKHGLTSTLIISQASTPWGLVAGAIICFAFHWPLDALNQMLIYHENGDSLWERTGFTLFRICCWGLLGLWSWYHPWTLLGIACGALWDIDHLLHWLIPSRWRKHRLHTRNVMFPEWARTNKALLVWVPVMALGLILIWW